MFNYSGKTIVNMANITAVNWANFILKWHDAVCPPVQEGYFSQIQERLVKQPHLQPAELLSLSLLHKVSKCLQCS